jgi:hypothetical protein
MPGPFDFHLTHEEYFMKAIAVLLMAAALVAGGTALAAGEHPHDPRHGGILVEGKQADFELVARPDVLQLYLSDHGKKMDHSRASAKVTLLAGKDKQEVTLAPAGADKLEARGTFKVAPGTKAVAVVTNAGKPVGTARFEIR